MLKKGLDFIQNDFRHNYSDLKHIMFLGSVEGFSNNSQIHVTDTFQRAMINDCLLDIAFKNAIEISDFASHECQYLIQKRNKDEIGAWSYFPSVSEIAADIDDLGQMMQLFLKSNNRQFVDKYLFVCILFSI